MPREKTGTNKKLLKTKTKLGGGTPLTLFRSSLLSRVLREPGTRSRGTSVKHLDFYLQTQIAGDTVHTK